MISAYPNPQSTPLSILLFHAAMQRDRSLAEFAADLGIGVATLRSYLFESKSSDRIRSATIARMAEVLGYPAATVRTCLLITPVRTRSFSSWLTEQLSGKRSRAALRRDTGISDSALKNYLQGDTTPDPHNARRIADALQAPLGLLAELIVTSAIDPKGDRLPPAAGLPATVPAPLMTIPQPAAQPEEPAAGSAEPQGYTEEHLLTLFRRLHPHGRRATLHYIAMLLAEE
jgi:transcriptional regulator with XRE-family HTH domain